MGPQEGRKPFFGEGRNMNIWALTWYLSSIVGTPSHKKNSVMRKKPLLFFWMPPFLGEGIDCKEVKNMSFVRRQTGKVSTSGPAIY